MDVKGNIIAVYQGGFEKDKFQGAAKWIEYNDGKKGREELYNFSNGELSQADKERIAKSMKKGCCSKPNQLPKPKPLSATLNYKNNTEEQQRRSKITMQEFGFEQLVGMIPIDIWEKHSKHMENGENKFKMPKSYEN